MERPRTLNASIADRHADEDPIYLVRSIGRMAQMLLEIRDEYIEDPTDDALDQFERRLDEIGEMARKLRALRDQAASMS